MGLWVICVYSSEKCQLTSFIYLNKVVLLLLMCRSSSYMVWILICYQVGGLQIFSSILQVAHSADCASLHILRFSILT